MTGAAGTESQGTESQGTDRPGTGRPGTDTEPVIVRVDRDRCIGSGMCALSAPASLALGEDGLARPVAEYAAGGGELTDDLSDAVDFCPVEALTLHSALGGHRIAPAE